jgi:hypothetical protein
MLRNVPGPGRAARRAAGHGPGGLAPGLLLLLLAVVLGVGPAVQADVVVGKDGTTYEGRVLLEDEEKVVIETTFAGTRTLARSEVRSVDTRKPPLRDQLAYRTEQAAGDAKALWTLHEWARKQGFVEELPALLEQVVAADPQHRKARERLGHVKVGGQWMTPAEKAQHDLEQQAAEMEAKGLVLYEGAWITPQERDAREQGLKKDGDEWITEEEWRRRRGERLVDGAWVRLGETEGKAFAEVARLGSRLPMTYTWSPHFDVMGDVPEPLTRTIAEGSEKAWAAARRLLRPEGTDLPEDEPSARFKVFLHVKLPAYTRFATWFADHVKADEIVKGWVGAVQRQHAWWWVQDLNAVGCYQFPNTDKTFVSNTVHTLGKAILTIYRRDYRFPRPWLQEGFAYVLEMEALGYSMTFSLGRGVGSQDTGEDTDVPIWADSDRWREALRGAVDAGTDPPLRRLARMDISQFRYVELVKSWSVVECLIRWDAAKFKQFVDLTKDKDADEEQALRDAFGVDYRTLDDRWRTWVQAGFVHAK